MTRATALGMASSSCSYAAVALALGEPVRMGDRLGQRDHWTGVSDALVRSVLVIGDPVLAQRVQQVSLVEDQGSVE